MPGRPAAAWPSAFAGMPRCSCARAARRSTSRLMRAAADDIDARRRGGAAVRGHSRAARVGAAAAPDGRAALPGPLRAGAGAGRVLPERRRRPPRRRRLAGGPGHRSRSTSTRSGLACTARSRPTSRAARRCCSPGCCGWPIDTAVRSACSRSARAPASTSWPIVTPTWWAAASWEIRRRRCASSSRGARRHRSTSRRPPPGCGSWRGAAATWRRSIRRRPDDQLTLLSYIWPDELHRMRAAARRAVGGCPRSRPGRRAAALGVAARAC